MDRGHTEVSYHKALISQIERMQSFEILEKKRSDAVEENLLHMREELCRPGVIMKTCIAAVRLLPSSTNVIVLTQTLKKCFILELHLHIFCFPLSFLRE